ncbi:MAG TPA: 3-hydroxybutyryl-CoA dehydrogenase [Terriglobia bacterium]|nr:3-hydroxybutyryl-CoA dehydrogenase [Terriglobia bacterium]
MGTPGIIGIVGSGTMGNGIAHVASRTGFQVVLADVEQTALARAVETISRNLDREIAKNKLSMSEKSEAISRIATTTDISRLAESDFIIEAVTEDFSAKAKLFQSLDAIARPEVILASNTSSISITRMASKTQRPDRVIGMHFMNPVPVMTLVEIVRGLATSSETCQATRSLAESFGKTPVEVADFPGFVSNRVLMPMINEAIFCVMEGVGSPEAVDTVMKLGMNHPIGPLALADLIGLDVCLSILEVLQEGLGDPKYRPCPLLRKMVDAGQLGRKSGQGFYQY